MVHYTGHSGPSCDPYCYDGHDGTDFWMSYEPVIAAAAGYVRLVGWYNGTNRNSGYGLYVEVRHDNNYVTRYGHLSTVSVSLNQYVQAGQIIGASGNTGNSTAPHLHFGVLKPGEQPVDPFGWTGGYQDPWQTYSGAVSSCLWKDGEWANLCGDVSRPIPEPVNGGEISIDDNPYNNGGFSKGQTGPFNNPCTGGLTLRTCFGPNEE